MLLIMFDSTDDLRKTESVPFERRAAATTERFNKNKFFDCFFFSFFFVIFIFSSQTYGCRQERAKKDARVSGSNTSEIALEGARRRRKAQGTL